MTVNTNSKRRGMLLELANTAVAIVRCLIHVTKQIVYKAIANIYSIDIQHSSNTKLKNKKDFCINTQCFVLRNL